MNRKRQKLIPGKTKKKLKLSIPETTSHPSNLKFICNKEVVIQLERLSESIVAEMTAGGSALPPEQTKKKLKLSAPETTPHPSNTHFICDKEVVIQLERLSESVVAEMTAVGSSLPPEQVIAELEQVKEEGARDKINFETEKCDLESKIYKYKEQCTELQSENEKLQNEKEELQSENEKLRNENKKLQSENENVQSEKEKLQSEKEKLQSEKEKLQSEKEKLQSENKKLQKYLRDLESSNINVKEKSQMNLYNTDLNIQITKVNKTNDDAFNINSLPNEIILKVFSYLTQNQLGQIARVCRRWNVLTKSPVLWRKVNVKIFSSDTEKYAVANSFINGLTSCVTFIRLDFAESVFSEWEDLIPIDFEELCVKLHQKCPHLEELILACCAISNILPEVINFCTLFLQCVKKLAFHYCRFTNHSRTVELNENSKIEVLNLCCCDIRNFNRTQFSKLHYLKELLLSVTDVDDTWFVDDASFFNHLHVLDLGITHITASTFLAIQNHSHNLKELYLCKLNLQAHDLNFNKSVLPQLKTICLSCCRITCEGVISLIKSCPSLQKVYVNRDVARSFAAHPFLLANRCKSGIVKVIHPTHFHNINYLHT